MVWGLGLGHFCPLLDSSIRHSALELSIWLTGAWKDLHHGLRFSLPNLLPTSFPFRGIGFVSYLKAFFPLFPASFPFFIHRH